MSVVASMLGSKTYPLDEKIELVEGGPAMALVALSHTPVERRLYAAMLNAVEVPAQPAVNSAESSSGAPLADRRDVFTVRRVMELAGSNSVSAIRRGLERLASKLSVAREARANGSGGNGGRDRGVAYRVFTPEEVIARRDQRGIKSFASGREGSPRHHSFARVIPKLLANRNLSFREAQVTLCCVEGMTNAEIGSRLLVSEQTVKFHLRNIFVKFGVKRQAELISRLLM
jgi:DNA-binding CsgD family transcriptional regulator